MDDAKPSYKLLSKEHFESILQEALYQVFEGKGRERHGNGIDFSLQPWKSITDNVGTGFVIGQALKKLMEVKNLTTTSSYKRELLGAIVYIVMAIMYREYTDTTNEPGSKTI